MVKIQDIYGKDYDIPDLESFVSHIKKYHTINGIPDDSVHVFGRCGTNCGCCKCDISVSALAM